MSMKKTPVTSLVKISEVAARCREISSLIDGKKFSLPNDPEAECVPDPSEDLQDVLRLATQLTNGSAQVFESAGLSYVQS